jgi:hypothetical protein
LEAIMLSLSDTLARWWSNWRTARRNVAALDCCGSEEAERIAHDVGVTAPELRTLAGKWPDSTNLLMCRLAAFKLNPGEIRRKDPGVLQDLQRVCTLCANTEDCAHDLARNPSDPVWHVYCPNVMTIQALVAERATAAKAN